MLLAGLGGGIGLGLAWMLIARGDPTNGALPCSTFRQLVIGLGLTLGLGLVAGLVPAWQAMRLGIAEALRKG